MPNHCSNALKIEYEERGKIQAVKDILAGENAAGEETVLTFHSILPVPDDLIGIQSGMRTDDEGNKYRQWRAPEDGDIEFIDQEEVRRLEEKHGAANPLDWQRRHWSTKWDAYNVELTDESVFYARYTFTTAWCPPENFVAALRKVFPKADITLSFNEPGMALDGTL